MIHFMSVNPQYQKVDDKMRTTRAKTLAAMSVEYIIILVLIAIGGIIGFIILGGQIRNQVGTSVDKLSGKETTNTTVNQGDTARLENASGMDGTDTGDQAQEFTTGAGAP